MAQTNKPWYKRGWAIIIFVFVGLAIVGSFLSDTNDNQLNTNTQNQIIQSADVSVTSQIVKRVDGRCRYFFDIRNNEDENFEGSVKIKLITQEGISVWSDTFTVNQAIEPTLGASVYTDANTCPVAIHGSSGISAYEYEIKINNQIVKTGTGEVTDNFEEPK